MTDIVIRIKNLSDSDVKWGINEDGTPDPSGLEYLIHQRKLEVTVEKTDETNELMKAKLTLEVEGAKEPCVFNLDNVQFEWSRNIPHIYSTHHQGPIGHYAHVAHFTLSGEELIPAQNYLEKTEDE